MIRELIDALADSPNRFVLTTRYVARAHRLLRDATARFEVIHQPPLQPSDVTDVLAPVFGGYERMNALTLKKNNRPPRVKKTATSSTGTTPMKMYERINFRRTRHNNR